MAVLRAYIDVASAKEIMSSPVTTIAEVGKHEGQSVTIRGWLYNLRESGKLLFPQFRDGSGVIQVTAPSGDDFLQATPAAPNGS